YEPYGDIFDRAIPWKTGKDKKIGNRKSEIGNRKPKDK
ncbi:uncharacterized protein METZ01_LOCUS395835, partial [marine metagenome]